MTSLVALKCPSCNGALRAEDLDEARGFAKCSYCRALVSLPASAAAAEGFKPRREVPLPPRIALADTADGIEIRLRWFTPLFVFLAFFCITWNSFLVFWYSIAFAGGTPWIMKVFPLAHVAVGVGLTYFTLAGFLNTTSVRVENGRLSVAHGPLPWKGNREFDGQDIAQLYCKERVHHNKNGTSTSYELWAVRKDGASFKLLGAGSDSEQSLFLEQHLERALKLKDSPVQGELSR